MKAAWLLGVAALPAACSFQATTKPEPNSTIAGSCRRGPGGVGKSFLLAHVLEAAQPARLGWLVLTADAANPDTRGDFLGLIEGQLFRRSLPPPADRTKDYFPHLREIAALHREFWPHR